MPVNIDVPGLGPVSIPDDVPVNLVDDYVSQIAKSKNINLPAPEIPKKPYTFGAGLRDVAVGTAGIIPSFAETFAEFTPTDTFGRLTGADKGIASLLKGVAPEYSEDIGKLGISRGNAKFMRDLQKDLYSEQSKAAQKNLAKKLEESTSLLDEAGIAARETLTTPELLASYGPEALSSLVGGRFLGNVFTKVGKAVAPKLAEAAGERAAKILGEKGMKFLGGPETIKTVVGGATMQGASVANQNFNSVMEMEPAKLAETPEYQAAIKEGASPEDARRIVAEGAASGSLLPATALSLVAQYAVPGGHSLEQLVAGAAGKTLGKSASQFGKQTAKSFFGEGFSEAGEEGGGQYLGNIFMPGQQDPMQGVGAAAGMAGAMGALMGGGAGGINALQAQRAQKVMEERAQAEKEKEQAIPDVAEIAHPLGSNLAGETVSAEAKNFLSKAEKDKPFGLDYINKQTSDDVAHEGDATAVANELIRRGEVVNTGTEEAPQFSFIKEEDRIAPHLDGTTPYFYASPVTRQTGETTAEGYEVTNTGINVTRKAATPEEAENIKTQMDARVERMTGEIDKKIESQNEIISAVSENLNIAIASDMSDEKLSEEHDNAAAKIAEAQQQIEQLNQEREKIATPTEVKPINEKKGEESGYEVRQYRPGKTAKTVVPFATREEAEKFIAENAALEQQQAIYQDEAPHREGLRKAQKDLFAPEETPTEEGAETTFEPQATPEMQQKVQAVTSRLRGVLDQMGLQNIGLNISNKLTSMVNGQMTPVDGYYLNRVIHASLDNTRGVLATFGHETVHALRELGMFSDKEWDILTRKAKSEWIKKYRTEERYGNLSEEEQIEEAIADAFGDWMGGKYKPTGVIQGLLNRMKLFLESMGSTLRGQGFDSTDKVFQRALKGELKGAREERPSEGAKFAQRKPEHTHAVVDPRNNNKVMGYYKGLSNALRGRDRLDNAYGAYRYRVEKIKPEDAKYALPRTSRTELGLYSALADSIQNIQTNAAPAAGWKQAIQGLVNKGQVKKDEVEWSGINDWLDLQQGKVTKQQVEQYLRDGGVRVEEVALGVPEMEQRWYVFDDAGMRIAGYDKENAAQVRAEKESLESNSKFFVREELVKSYKNPTNYGSYTLPGGENYREVLLTLPKSKRLAEAKQKFNDLYRAKQAEAKRLEIHPNNIGFFQRDEAYRAEHDRLMQIIRTEESNQYKSGHWNQGNILAHIRVNDRIDSEGNRVLFVEELQSDWAQQGSKVRRKEVKRLIQSGLSKDEANKRVPLDFGFFNKARLDALDAKFKSNGLLNAEEAAEYNRLVDMESLPRTTGSVPAAPFITNTEGWLNLALKRIMVMAAEGGYEKVAFVNGEQSADRYDLSKQVRSITGTVLDDGRLNVDVDFIGDEQGPTFIVNDENELAEKIGKDPAERLFKKFETAAEEGRQSSSQSIKGGDLKIGGEGMKAFYDQIVPTAVKKLLPKVGGGKLETVSLQTKDHLQGGETETYGLFADLMAPEGKQDFVYKQNSENQSGGIRDEDIVAGPFENREQALNWLHSNEPAFRTEQTGFNVTQEMREKAQEGIPQFALSQEDYENLSPESQQVMAEDFLYSPLNRLVINAPNKLENQSAGVWRQWFNANANQAGGKEGEYFWTGLDEWLMSQGKNKVSQKQIVDYLQAFDNPRDVVYESAGRPEIGVIDVTDQMPEQVDPNGKPVEGAYEFVVNIGGQNFSFIAYKFDRNYYPFDLYDVNNELIDSFEDIEDIKQELAYEANESLGANGNSKFSEWTLDGGDNYREIPVVLSGPAAKNIAFNYYNSHFPDANVLYHLRTNDRQDVLGNNVLFVEEVQSDWAQSGRDVGFVLRDEKEEAQRIEKEKEKINLQIEQLQYEEGRINDYLIEAEYARKKVSDFEEKADMLSELRNKITELYKKIEELPVQKVPAGPYVQDTGKWVELAAKRIIAMAVSGGYDKVAFINPAQAHYRFPEKSDGGSTKEGFENFYGKILPNKLNSLLKKYGSQVEVVDLPVVGDSNKWVADGDISQQLGFTVTPELVKSVRQNGFPRHALPMTVLAQGKRKPSLNANGSQIYPTKDGIRNFWRWFGDGQLVDKGGRPRLFYHGSTRNIEAFKTGTADAIFFSPSPIPADIFINYKAEELGEDRNKGVVYPVYLNPKNVFDYENEEQVNRLVDEVMRGANIKIFQNIRKVILHPYYSVKVPSEGGGTEEEFYVAPESIIEPKKYSKEGLRQRLMSGAWPVFETGEVIDAIKRLGFDGFFITEATKGQFYKNVAVFSPKQIKAAFGNNGEFGLGSDKIQFALPQNVLGQPATLPTWTEPTDSKTDDAIFQIQDKMVDVKRVVQEITKAAGNILDKWNPYLQEELYHGRTAQQTERFLRTELRPLLLDLSKHNISIPEFEEFLHNRHAEERNKQIASINPAMPDAGSGIATQTARNYLNAIPPARRRLLDSIARRVDDINRGTRQVLVDSGLELPQTIASWEQTYPHYVPLFREDADYVTTSGYGVGQGFNIRGDFSKRAMGSNRGVVQIFSNIVMQRERAIIRAEKNRVAQSVYGLAVQNPNKDFWLPIDPEAIKDVSKVQNELLNLGISPNDIQNIFQQPTRKVIDHRTGLVTNKIDPYVLNSPNILATRINGRNHYLLFNSNDPRAKRMVSALKNLDADQLGRVMSIMGGISRWFARVNTQYNPIFGIVNFLRDIEGATLNLSTTPIADKVKDVMSVENLNGALGAIWKVSRAERDKGAMPASKWAKLWQELQEEGGQTGYRSMYSSAEERADAIKTEIKNIDGTGVMPKLRALGDFLSDYNTSMENAVRLTAYKAALDKGLSKQQAASVAKNITVNFNRKGNIATQMGALYAFFNASVQGNARILETLRGPMAKKIIYGGLLLGIVQALALAAAGFDEDEPPEFLKERNIVIPVGGKKYISIPMPLGYNVIPNVSRNIMEWCLSGFRDTGKHITGIFGSLIDTFNPIGGGGWSLQTVAPTALDPFAALAENKDSFGRPIYKSELNATDPTPGYLRTKDTATAWSKWMAEFLNKVSGGTKYKPGGINWTPDQIDYVIGQIGGGVAREIGKGAQAVSSISTGEELAPYKIPLVGRFYGNAESNAAQMQRYYDNITRLNEHENEIKGRRKNHEPVFEYIKENPEAKLVPISNSIENNIKELRQQKKRLTERGANPEQIKRINDRIIAQMKRLNEQVKKLRD